MLIAASAQVIGNDHNLNGLPCQDGASHLVSDNGNDGVIIVCDGAGSQELSHHGAALICNLLPAWIMDHDQWWDLSADQANKQITNWVSNQLQHKALELGCDTKNLSSTLVAIATHRKGDTLAYRFLHIGDGIAGCIDPFGIVTLSHPDNAEHVNETVFTTSPQLESDLRITEGDVPEGSGFVVMTDGPAEKLYQRAKQAIAPAAVEMLQWLNEHDSTTVSEALSENISTVIKRKTAEGSGTDDDCGISIMLDRRADSPFVAEIAHPDALNA